MRQVWLKSRASAFHTADSTAMTGPAASKKQLLSLSQIQSNFNEDAFQRELLQLRVSRIHAYPSTIFARGGLMPTVPSRNSITITGRNVSRTSLFEASPFDLDDIRAMQTKSPEHMEPAARTPEPRPPSCEKSTVGNCRHAWAPSSSKHERAFTSDAGCAGLEFSSLHVSAGRSLRCAKMSYLGREQLRQLEAFVEFCKTKPEILHKPELSFFKQYLESLGAKISPAPRSPSPPPKTKQPEEVNMEEPTPEPEPEPVTPESEESEVELDNSGVVEPDHDDPLPMGDSSVEVTEEQMEQSSEKRGQAMEAQSEGKLEESLKLWTEAIELNPSSAILFAKRANVLLKMEKPNAAIRDANKALELNPDQALGYKIRGRAHRLLGHWEEAAKDLATACRLDYTDEANEWLKEVAPNAKKLQEHRRKWERKREERELKERAERVRKAREEQQRRYEQQQKEAQDDDDLGGIPGFPGGMPGGLGDCFQDPEILAAFQDPEVAAAFQDISQNPMNIGKYQSNPKIKNIMAKMAAKMGAQAPPM